MAPNLARLMAYAATWLGEPCKQEIDGACFSQVFPTRLRTFGLGVNNAMSRIGALLSPFLAVDLVERGHPGAAEACIAVFCVAAAIATAALPVETSGKALMVRSVVSRL